MNGQSPPRMTPDRWRRIGEIFSDALGRPAWDREGFVVAVCGDDEELGAEVTALLAAHTSGPMDSLEADLPREIREALPADPAPGARLGPYRLVDRIGQGGMGIVYLAERDDADFEQRVAVKLLRGGVGASELAGRFLAERRILATLEHPHITRLLDGGVTAGGVPFFVMEHVDGAPIHRYCDERRLSLRERLALFVGVCDAMQYAHSHLVVHRDLKPSNVLVKGDGTVKVLDFGIAKLLDEQEAAAGRTRTGRRWMTPEYASPEQVRDQPVTAASDVYALGVVLYELLTGRHPHEVEGGGRHDVERAILEREPSMPSAAVSRLAAAGGAEPDRIAAARGTPPGKLRRQLAGDLDTIVLKALQKEPGRRYAMAGELAEDLRRHLAGLPVLARPDTLGYRAGKFVRRHRLGVGASALLAMTLSAGAAGTAWQARVAAAERDVAAREATKAREVSAFLIRLFEVSDPSQARGDTVTARELLDEAVVGLDELASQPDVQAAMATVLGQVYGNLGHYDRAHSLLEQALATLRSLPDAAPVDVAETVHQLGVVQLRRARYDDAESALRQALALREAHLEETHPALTATRHELAGALRETGQPEEAAAMYRRVLAVREPLRDVQPAALAASLHGLAVVLHDQGDYAGAAAMFEEVAGLQEAMPAVVSPDIASSLTGLAVIRLAQRRFQEAERFFERGLSMQRALFGPTHPEVATTLTAVGELRHHTGRHAEADDAFREALSIFDSALGEAHLSTAVARQTFGRFLLDQGDHARAETQLRRALAVFRASEGEARSRVVVTLHDLAELSRATGSSAVAEARYLEADSIGRELYGGPHVYLALGRHGLGRLAQDRGDDAAAAAYYREAIAIGEQVLPTDHPYLARFREDLAKTQLQSRTPSPASRR